MDSTDLDLLEIINQKYQSLSKGHKRIANYILSDYDKAAFMTASKLGEVVDISESTVVRFANSLGFKGYPQLQNSLHELIKNKLTTVQRLSLTSDVTDTEQLYKNIIRADIDNIKSTLHELEYDNFHNIINSICRADNVYIIGLRSSTVLAEYLGFYLNILLDNIKVVNYRVNDIFEQLLHVNEKDIVISISYPRYSKRTIEALNYVKNQNCKIVAITDSIISPIAKIADFTLVAKSEMISFVDSLVAPMSLINSIIIAIGLLKKDKVSKTFTKLEQIWKDHNIYEFIDKNDLIL